MQAFRPEFPAPTGAVPEEGSPASTAGAEDRRLYEELVSSLPLGVYRVAQDGDGFRFVYVSDRYCETVGLSRESLLADAASSVAIIHPEDRPGFDRVNRDALARRAPFHWEGRAVVNNEIRWFHVQSHPSESHTGPLTWTGMLIDVTDRRRAETALRESEYFLARSQAVSRLGTYSFFIRLGTWTCTPMLRDVFGIDASFPQTVDGWLSLVVPEHRGEMSRHLLEHVIAGRNRFDHEYQIIRPSDGRRRWVRGLGELEFDDDGEPVRMIGTIQDITDRKRAEEERLDLERRLLHAQKLESLGVLAGGIAHDFNNLLVAMLGNLDLALTQLAPVSPVRGSLEQALVAAQRAADLTRQMLAYSGKASFDVRATDLNELVEENVHLFRACIPKTVTLSLQLGQGRHVIVADAGQVHQVIMNLIINAAEALGSRPGVVTLSTGETVCSAEDLGCSRLEQVAEPGRFVFLEVRDTGCGMDAETLQRLFDPFFTTKTMGRGLGMSALLGIVRGHKGAIFVDSGPGSGTTVRALFPASAEALPSRNVDPTPARPAAADLPSGAILVVDDEQVVRHVCRRMLQQGGWPVIEADGGPAAIDLFTRRRAEIVCVLLDLSMPQMDGFAVFDALRRIQPGVRVILTSGYSHHQEQGQGLQAKGFAGFIQKPYTAAALRDEVARVLAETPPPPG